MEVVLRAGTMCIFGSTSAMAWTPAPHPRERITSYWSDYRRHLVDELVDTLPVQGHLPDLRLSPLFRRVHAELGREKADFFLSSCRAFGDARPHPITRIRL